MKQSNVRSIVRNFTPKLASLNSPDYVIPNLSGDLSHGRVRDKDFEIWNGVKLRCYNPGNEAYGEIYKNNSYLVIDGGVGGNRYVEIDAGGSEQMRFFGDIIKFSKQKPVRFYATDENYYGTVRWVGGTDVAFKFENDRDTGHCQVDGKAAVDLMVNGTKIFTTYSSGSYAYSHVSFRGGANANFYNAANNENGNIRRDNDYLYVEAGTGANLKLTAPGVIYLEHPTAGTGMDYCFPYDVEFFHNMPSWGSNINRRFFRKSWANDPGDYLYMGATGNTTNTIMPALLMGNATSGAGHYQSGIRLGLGTDNGNDLNNEFLRIVTRGTAAGRVGIGTSGRDPTDLLEVNGYINAVSGYKANGSAGASGSFTSADGKTVTVTNGIITSIV